MAGIPTSNILQPGQIAVSNGVTRALISQLQLLVPQVYNKFVEKYGPENWTWWLATYGGMETVKNRAYEWFENRSKLQQAFSVASGATTTAGSTITLTLSSGYHYNSGTQTPLAVGLTLRHAPTNTEFEIITIPVTTAYAYQFTARPKIAATTLTVSSGDVFIIGGFMDVGEASTTKTPAAYLTQRYTNTTTEMRATYAGTDLGEMTDVWITNGATGDLPSGANQAGTSYYTYLNLVYTNKEFVNNVEFKMMRGNIVDNSGLGSDSSVGTLGVIPKILADGETVTYSSPTIDIAKLHEITRIMDVNGCAKQNQWLMDIFQKQQFSDGIFSQFPAGAFVWGNGANSEEASVAYGFKNIFIDGYMLQTAKYSNLNTEAVTGVTPTTDFFRNFGFIVPTGGTTNDAKTPGRVYNNLSVMVQNPVQGGSIGNGIRVWEWGGGSRNPSDGTMIDHVEMITYRGTRFCAANQAIIVEQATS